jgi:hypothetical protein
MGLEAVGGLLLLDGSRGQGVDPRLGLGLRATWELGRTLAQEALRERLLLDVAWWTGGAREGTPGVYGDTRLHYFSAAPAWLFPLGGEGSPWGAYLQVGAGLAFQDTAITASGVTTRLGGLKPLFQYGAGLRGRLKVANRVHLSLRAELTRFRRGYLDDTLLGASVGTAF